MGACVTCQQQITNPLSPQRLALQMKVWLAEARPHLTDEFEDLAATEDFETGTDVCIKTGTRMHVCAYCFTEMIYTWLVKVAPDLIPEYLQYFNYDEASLGYWKDAEQKSLIA